tara:strand:+ start:252 stop:416 length:165 start_codon:yes stop_codon:yes gene_type:complete
MHKESRQRLKSLQERWGNQPLTAQMMLSFDACARLHLAELHASGVLQLKRLKQR